MVYIIQTVWMSYSIMIKEIIHLRSAAGMHEIMFTDVIRNDLQHRPVQIGIDRITDPQAKGFIAVNRHSWRKKLLVISRNLSKKVHYLTAVNVDHSNGLPSLYLDSFSGTSRDRVFHGVTSIQQAVLVKKL